MKFANNSANTNGRASTLIAYDGPCLFFSLHVHAGSGGGAYVMLFDSRALPTSGTRPKRVWQVIESTSFDHETTNGVPLQNGCVIACSSTEFEYTALDALPLMDVVFYIPPPNLPPKTDPITAATLEPATKPAPPPQRPPPASTPAGRPAPTSKPLKATVAALLAGFLTLCCSSAWAASSTTPGTTGGGSVGVKTQGVSVVTSATSINFVTGSNTFVLVTNAAGAVSVQVNATATGSGGGSTQMVTAAVGTLAVTNPVTGTGFRQSSVRASRGLLIGDSMTAAGIYAGYVGLDSYLLSPADVLMGTVISNQATGGHGVSQQKAIWEADTNKLSYDWFGIQLGINGVLNINDDITNTLYQLQGLVNSVASQKKPSAVIALATITPVREWINTYYDFTNSGSTTFAGTVYTNWVNYNAAIMGGTTNAITNVTFRTQRHTLALDNGNGFLVPFYNPSADGYHTENQGRKVAAAAYRELLNAAGYLENEKALDYSSPWRTDGTNTVQTQGSNVFTLGRVTVGSIPGSGPLVAQSGGLLFATNSPAPLSPLAGVGGALTNFTLVLPNQDVSINGFTNVSLRAIMGYSAAQSAYWTITVTNGSGSNRTLEFSQATNAWRFAGTYGTNAPTILTNGTTLLLSGRSVGTNANVGYTYFAWP